MTERLRVVPANEVSWEQLQTVFGTRGDAAHCQCQWVLAPREEYRHIPVEQRRERLREQAACGHPESGTTSGLVAFAGDEPVGWCAVQPRSRYVRLRSARVPWAGRHEDRDDDGVWAVVCFVVRPEHRRQGVSTALATAAVEHARSRGARAIEGYPKELAPGKTDVWGELFVGTPAIFASAGFHEVSRPTPRRLVMRRELD